MQPHEEQAGHYERENDSIAETQMSDIADIICKGEGKTLEFKETLPSGESLARTAAAFFTHGGTVLAYGIDIIFKRR